MAKNSTMRKVSLRNIAAHKLRLALTVLAVVLGTAFISGAFMFTNSLDSTFKSAVSSAYDGVDGPRVFTARHYGGGGFAGTGALGGDRLGGDGTLGGDGLGGDGTLGGDGALVGDRA